MGVGTVVLIVLAVMAGSVLLISGLLWALELLASQYKD
jgi:nitrogen fixation-related uncharacterized protein